MKKLFTIAMLAIISTFAISCDTRDENVEVKDNDTYGVAYDISPTFTRKSSNLYQYGANFNKSLLESDVVLIYMQTGASNNSPIWRLLPYTFFVDNANNDEIDYSFDFSKFDFQLSVNSTPTLNLDANTSLQYYNGRTFRVVIVPAQTGKAKIDYSDYNSVIKFYNIDESKIKLKN